MKLKIFIDKNTNKVLYAEAGKDFVDLLLHTFMKPLGVAIKQDFNDSIPGSLANLYTSVADGLSVDYLQSGSITKVAFHNPNHLKTFYTNKNCPSSCPNVVSEDSGICETCSTLQTCYEKAVYEGPVTTNNILQIGEGYVKGQVTYMVTDDLVVNPLSTSLSMSLLSELGIKDIACVCESEVTLDSNKVMELVKASLTSKTVLTDILLPLKPAK